MIEFELLLDDGHEHVDGDGDPDLSLDGILGSAEEGLDAKVLLDPFEEQFYTRAMTIEFGDGQCRELEIVG